MKKLLVILLCLPMIFSCRDKTGCILGDCENGYGTFIWPSGNKYVGEWKDGKKHGQGTYTYADGTIEKGLWENDEFKGK